MKHFTNSSQSVLPRSLWPQFEYPQSAQFSTTQQLAF